MTPRRFASLLAVLFCFTAAATDARGSARLPLPHPSPGVVHRACPGHPHLAGCVTFGGAGITIHVRSHRRVVLEHELGHVVDHLYLSARERSRFQTLTRTPGAWATRHMERFAGRSPSERFAGAYAMCRMSIGPKEHGWTLPGRRLSTGRFARVCRFIAGAMRSRSQATPGLDPGLTQDPMPPSALTGDPTPTPAPASEPVPVPTVTPPSPGIGVFNPAPLATNLNHTSFGTYVGATQACDLGGKTGVQNGTDHAVTFTSAGLPYRGCYSINSKLGAAPPGGAKRPAVFVFGPGNPRKASTSAEVLNAGNEPLGIIGQGKSAGWDMIYLGMFKFSDPSSQYNFTYDQVYADYTRAIISDLIANHRTDPARIYSYGSSGGGRVPTFMACHLSDRFAAVVSQAGSVSGPRIAATSAADRCSRPPNPVSTMYVYANGAQVPDGNPLEHYAVHLTPTHRTLTPADISDIEALRPSQIYYAMQHVGEAWADWNGCGSNLSGFTNQTVTVGVSPNNSPGTKLWRWTGCRDESGHASGEVDLYIVPGSHGVERRVQDDGRAFQFLRDHAG